MSRQKKIFPTKLPKLPGLVDGTYDAVLYKGKDSECTVYSGDMEVRFKYHNNTWYPYDEFVRLDVKKNDDTFRLIEDYKDGKNGT